jgi:hypothetical protein
VTDDVIKLNTFQMCIRRGDFYEQMGNYQIFKNDCAVWGCRTNTLLCRKEVRAAWTENNQHVQSAGAVSRCSQHMQSACHSIVTGPLIATSNWGHKSWVGLWNSLDGTKIVKENRV